ncbi:hypothetical protein VKT23_012033 [Stygiomarasmius scandens]|uniref:Golgi apparatus membrane protein TVP38 n=1 Tax=Marasmiellus scandens TaxID=2682957 RepID=A0ABR1J7H1_9AGAR
MHTQRPSGSRDQLLPPTPAQPADFIEMSDPVPRDFTRTPSPTPSEVEALNTKTVFSFNTKKSESKKKQFILYAIIVVLVAISILFIVFKDKIIHGLEPAAHWLHDTPGGWVIPIVILIILSFPPLFGHEIVAMLCGIVWGLGIGFLIVAAGTILGELANLYVFRYFSKKTGKLEKNIAYACLTRVVKDGGFWIALLIRYSLMPAHLATTIFAFCGMSSLIFLAAAILSLPKQLITVFLGFSLEKSADGTQSKTSKDISIAVVVVGSIVGVAAFRFITYRVNQVKAQVIYERQKARQVQHMSTVEVV